MALYRNAKAAKDAGLVRLGHHAPYIAESAYGCNYIPVPGLKEKLGGAAWIGIDEWCRIYYDDKVILDKPPFEIALTFMHEDWHPLRMHAQRARVFWESIISDPVLGRIAAGMDDARRNRLWNIAADAEINQPLFEQFGKEPDAQSFFANCILPRVIREKFGVSTGDKASAEEFARAMLATQEDGGTGDPGDDGDEPGQPGDDVEPGDGGSGSDGQPRDWEKGEPGEADENGEPNPAGKDAISQEIARIETAKAIRQAEGQGTIPGGMSRWAEEKLTPPKIRWERELRAKVRRAVSFIAGHDDFTYAKPSTRRIPGVVLPGTHAPELIVDVLLDDSGSMGNGEGSRLSRGVAEIQGVCKAATKTRFTAFDSAANSKRITLEGNAPRNLFEKFTGGGGTDMSAGIAWCAAQKPKPRLIIVITDCETGWPSEKPKGIEVIVAAVGASDYYIERIPKWASVVRVED